MRVYHLYMAPYTLQVLAEAVNMADYRTAQLDISDAEWNARRAEYFRLKAQLDAARLAYAATAV